MTTIKTKTKQYTDNRPKMILKIVGDTVHCTNPYNPNVQFKVSVEDIDLVSKYVWNCPRSNVYIKRTVGHPRKDLHLHKVIMQPDACHVVDFVNGDPKDLRRCNLRLCRRSDDIKNRGLQRNNTSGYKGVSRCAKSGKFMAKIGSDCRQIFLGLFATKEEAAEAYNKAALKYHKEFANLNKITKREASCEKEL